MKLVALAELQLLDLFLEGAFRHIVLDARAGRGIRLYSKAYRAESALIGVPAAPWHGLWRSTNMPAANSEPNTNQGNLDETDHACRAARADRRRGGRPGGDAARGHVLRREDPVLEELRALHRPGQRDRQGPGQDQLHRRAARHAAVRGRQRGAHQGGRHRQRDRRVLHQPDAGGRRLQADRQADERAAQERHLGLHQRAAQPEAQFAISRAAVPQRAVPHLSQQEAGEARLHRAEDPRHAGLQGHRRGAGRHRHHHARPARSTPRWSAAWSTATAGR